MNLEPDWSERAKAREGDRALDTRLVLFREESDRVWDYERSSDPGESSENVERNRGRREADPEVERSDDEVTDEPHDF